MQQISTHTHQCGLMAIFHVAPLIPRVTGAKIFTWLDALPDANPGIHPLNVILSSSTNQLLTEKTSLVNANSLEILQHKLRESDR